MSQKLNKHTKYIHGESKKCQADYIKDRFVLRKGFRVLRFSNQEATNGGENLGRSP